ncbi:hypothetical protein FBD94_09735 [Pedobacter hiemivivus]|uniref:Lipoprotein n=1 Tax=Pedobacter hiemivivus TaxID=2530454 RepID=A0A4V6WPM6_9SPHI|nr:hypothetical protein [Pedobacter hiemivivus]TKC62486.1 hypothetical protein FBD94_09735 [Pedobacter hiemivivus]
MKRSFLSSVVILLALILFNGCKSEELAKTQTFELKGTTNSNNGAKSSSQRKSSLKTLNTASTVQCGGDIYFSGSFYTNQEGAMYGDIFNGLFTQAIYSQLNAMDPNGMYNVSQNGVSWGNIQYDITGQAVTIINVAIGTAIDQMQQLHGVYVYMVGLPIVTPTGGCSNVPDPEPDPCVQAQTDFTAFVSSTNDSAPSSEFLRATDASVGTIKKKNLYWNFHKQNQGLWVFESQDLAVYENNSGVLSFTGLTHVNEFFRGLAVGGSVSVVVKEANANVYTSNAGMQLLYFFKLEPLNCPLLPLLTTLDMNASHIFTTNELSGN